jgi:hypothetical protein
MRDEQRERGKMEEIKILTSQFQMLITFDKKKTLIDVFYAVKKFYEKIYIVNYLYRYGNFEDKKCSSESSKTHLKFWDLFFSHFF